MGAAPASAFAAPILADPIPSILSRVSPPNPLAGCPAFAARPDSGQPIKATGVGAGRFADGAPMIFLRLEGGAELPIVLEQGDLNELVALLQNIVAPRGELRH